MTPEKLQQWIYKACPGGTLLQLVHEHAIGTAPVVASWTRTEVDGALALGTTHQAEQVLDEAQTHADSANEACKFALQWVSDAGRALRTVILRAAPSEPTNNTYAANADSVSPNAMVAQLLQHIHMQQKVMNGSMGTVLSAYERALTMQQVLLTQAHEMLRGTRRELASLAETTSLTNPTDAEFQAMKARALAQMIDIGPDILRMAIAAFARPDNTNSSNAGDTTPDAPAPPSNGKAAHA